MATVANKGLAGGIVDGKLSSPNRIVAATPVATTTPLYSGEIVNDTTSEKSYRATGTTSADWELIYPE